jgi:hypothetical protein
MGIWEQPSIFVLSLFIGESGISMEVDGVNQGSDYILDFRLLLNLKRF